VFFLLLVVAILEQSNGISGVLPARLEAAFNKIASRRNFATRGNKGEMFPNCVLLNSQLSVFNLCFVLQQCSADDFTSMLMEKEKLTRRCIALGLGGRPDRNSNPVMNRMIGHGLGGRRDNNNYPNSQYGTSSHNANYSVSSCAIKTKY
jgi:hypothetical protein